MSSPRTGRGLHFLSGVDESFVIVVVLTGTAYHVLVENGQRLAHEIHQILVMLGETHFLLLSPTAASQLRRPGF